jgi:tetratricopeptide (TPR) repeat protein
MSLIEVRDDVAGYEILEMNSNGMINCQNRSLEEAEAVLVSALQRLQNDEGTDDPQFAERLKAITLNNLGVVSCHKGNHRKALEHLEAAFALENRLGIQSPSTTLNLCAAHNAMAQYEKAMQYALQTIEILHRLPANELEDHKVLWGAAWHNLGIAQLNTATRGSLTDASTVFSIFRNAMKATQELLGPRHPMTVAVHQTYRELRDDLKRSGVFVQHHTFPGLNEHEKELTVTLMSPDHFKYQQTTSNVPFVRPRKPGTGDGGKPERFISASQRFSQRLSRTLKSASGVYSEHHPLLQSSQRSRLQSRDGRTSSLSPRQQASSIPPLPSPPGTAQSARGVSGKRSPKVSQDVSASRRRLSELLMGDMWVDINVSASQSLLNSMPRPSRGKGDGAGENFYPPVRPNYAEAMHVMEPSEFESPGLHSRVVDPQSNATLDHQGQQIPPPMQQVVPLGMAPKGVGASSTGVPSLPPIQPLGGSQPQQDESYEGLGALHRAVTNIVEEGEPIQIPNVRQMTERLASQGRIPTPRSNNVAGPL